MQIVSFLMRRLIYTYRLFDNLVSCLRDNITGDEQDCIDAAVQKIVGDLNKMVEYDGNFLDKCDDG